MCHCILLHVTWQLVGFPPDCCSHLLPAQRLLGLHRTMLQKWSLRMHRCGNNSAQLALRWLWLRRAGEHILSMERNSVYAPGNPSLEHLVSLLNFHSFNFFSFSVSQENVSTAASEAVRAEPITALHSSFRHCTCWFLSLSISRQQLAGGRRSWGSAAGPRLHPPGLSCDWRTLAEPHHILPPRQTHQ